MIEIIFLGTSCMQPTKERNHSAILLAYKDEGILFDCGEGTQRQLKIAGIKPTKITRICITHWHGDHVLGLPGLLQTMGANEYQGKLRIYGPEGTKKHMKAMLEAFVFDARVDFEVIEVKAGKFYEDKNYALEALPLEHSVLCLGFNFIEKDRRRIDMQKAKKLGLPEGPLLGELQDGKSITFKGKKINPDDVTYIVAGKKISFVSDTEVCNNAIKLAKNADLLICESAFASTLEDKAEIAKHLTAKQAGMIANKAEAKQLILTHFSQRYKTTQELEEDAKNVFSNVTCAYDFMKVKI